MEFLVIFFAVMIGGILVYGYVDQRQWRQQVQEAYQEYQEALIQLKYDPTNPDLRQRTLELGRDYSDLTRQKKGVTVYDEIALMNDINAATAGAVSVSKPSKSLASAQSAEERLAKLLELKSKGLIDEQEYTAKRKRILDEIKYPGSVQWPKTNSPQ